MTSYRYGLFAFFFRWVTLGLATWHLARAKSEDGGVFSGSTSACAACKEEYMPVCTSFGILVLNACVAECQGLSVGPCPGTEAPHRGATDLFTTEGQLCSSRRHSLVCRAWSICKKQCAW